MRIFVPGASALLTDHKPHGEGLISWNILSRLGRCGHDIVACARKVSLRERPPFEVVETGPTSRFESLEPLAYARRMDRELQRLGGAASFDAALWLMPQGRINLVWSAPAGLPLVIGPLFPAWPVPQTRQVAAGDIVRRALSPVFSILHDRMMVNAAAVLLSTPAAASELGDPAVPDTQVVPFGVDETRFAPSPLPDTPTIAFVGRLEALKGIADLLEAFELVRSRIPDVRLLVAGDGPERQKVNEIAGRSGGAVTLLGAVPNAEVPAVMAEASIFCLPSHGEPFGMAILEAMAAGRAVVTTDVGGPRFIVEPGQGGSIVRPRDPAALSEALVRALSNPAALEKSGRHNRERVEREFTWDRCVERIEAQLQEAAT